MPGWRSRSSGRATARHHIVLVVLLALCGVALAVLLTAAIARVSPSAGTPGIGPATSVPGRGEPQPAEVVYPEPQGDPAAASDVQVDPLTGAAPESKAYQAYGWIYHRDYPMDESGEQLAFGIVRDEEGRPGVAAYGVVWNRPAGLDITVEVPAGLDGPASIEDSQLTGGSLDRLEAARIPATFTDRTGLTHPGTHSGSVTVMFKGAGDADGPESVTEAFSPSTEAWSAGFQAGVADRWRLAEASITLDCPDLGVFEQFVADWDTDFAEIFYGTPLSIDLMKNDAMFMLAGSGGLE